MRDGEVMYAVVHKFEGGEGHLPSSETPEFRWEVEDGEVVMTPCGESGTEYRHPDITPILTSGGIKLPEWEYTYPRFSRTWLIVLALYWCFYAGIVADFWSRNRQTFCLFFECHFQGGDCDYDRVHRLSFVACYIGGFVFAWLIAQNYPKKQLIVAGTAMKRRVSSLRLFILSVFYALILLLMYFVPVDALMVVCIAFIIIGYALAHPGYHESEPLLKTIYMQQVRHMSHDGEPYAFLYRCVCSHTDLPLVPERKFTKAVIGKKLRTSMTKDAQCILGSVPVSALPSVVEQRVANARSTILRKHSDADSTAVDEVLMDTFFDIRKSQNARLTRLDRASNYLARIAKKEQELDDHYRSLIGCD